MERVITKITVFPLTPLYLLQRPALISQLLSLGNKSWSCAKNSSNLDIVFTKTNVSLLMDLTSCAKITIKTVFTKLSNALFSSEKGIAIMEIVVTFSTNKKAKDRSVN